MTPLARLSQIYASSQVVPVSDASKIVLMSDCHRGDGSWADDLLRNQNVYNGALSHYFDNGFTYIEIGDGDELWENSNFSDIVEAHKDSLYLLAKFHEHKRLYMMYGNHDIVKKDKAFVRDNLCCYYSARLKKSLPLFVNINIHEGLILRHEKTGRDIFLVHGHQVDCLNSRLWKLARFLVHHLWKPLEALGVNDPTSAAKNNKKATKVGSRLTRWCEEQNRMLIAGHTHRPVFPEPGGSLYFNDGSCVHPRCITAIEIEQGGISLVKWCVGIMQGGALYVKRDVLAGPEKLAAYFTPEAAKS
jgi:predicted phosphodiesterase